jgi:predicted enzyme related to lactoylglutathione lyase
MPVPTDGAVTEESEIVDMKLEVLVVPVSDVDRAKRFYETFGDAND